MPFDPTIPVNHAELTGVMFRGQFTGLKDLIDAVQSITSAQVDGTTTLNPGDAASVNLSVIGSVRLNFGIPRGSDGVQGPPFSSAVVDGVSTLNRSLDYTGKPDCQLCRLFMSMMEKMDQHPKTFGDARMMLEEV